MRITIEYEASWRNSFLDPKTSNNEPLPKNGRKFIGSMTNLKNVDNYISRDISIDTVMGVLNRLVGDQRKLYQARASDNYYFRDIESCVTFKDKPKHVNREVTFIRNITGSTDQNSFTGMIKTNDIIFHSNYSHELWSVLALNFDQLVDFIINNTKVTEIIDLDPISISDKFEGFKKIKPVEKGGDAETAVAELVRHFPETNYLNNKYQIVPENVFCSAFYLQIKRLSDSEEFKISSALTKNGTVPGISKRIFTKKDFMNRFTTGEKKKIWGNPYIRDEFVKGEGKTTNLLTKANGKLEVYIDIDRERARNVQCDIEHAGVSSFYLGKKGLAYVLELRI